VRLSGGHATMRVVRCEPGPSGAPVATRDVVIHWCRRDGWIKA